MPDDRYDILDFSPRRGALTASQEAVYRGLSDLQDRFVRDGRVEEGRMMQAVIEDYCGRWGGMYEVGCG